MTITIGIVVLCCVSFAVWAVTSNPRVQQAAGFVFTASLAAILVAGPHLLR